MEILVSLSANELQVRDRVAVKTDAGWFIGTVVLTKIKYATIKFDDGDTAEVVKSPSARDVKRLPAGYPKDKKSYKLKEINELIAAKEPIKPTKVKAEKTVTMKPRHEDEIIAPTPVPLPPKPPVPTLRQIGVTAPATSDTKHKPKPTADVSHATNPVEQLGIVYETEMRGHKEAGKLRRFMLDLWTALNKEKFDGRLRPVKKLMVIPANGRHGMRAFWHPYYRLIVFTDLVFKSRWDKFHEVFLHEMCHQAVTDLNHNGKAVAQAEGGHGPDWQAWMVRVGLEPKRYDDSTFKEYMTEEDRALFEEKADHDMSEAALSIVRKKDHYEEIKTKRLPVVKNGPVGAYVVFSNGMTEEPLEGVITDYEMRGGHKEYTVNVYIAELRFKDHVYIVREGDENQPLHFMKEPRLKYKAVARKLAEEARAIGRTKGKAR